MFYCCPFVRMYVFVFKKKKSLKLSFEASSSFSNEQYITDKRSCYVYGTSDETEVDFKCNYNSCSGQTFSYLRKCCTISLLVKAITNKFFNM
jgi:hypothetical protein